MLYFCGMVNHRIANHHLASIGQVEIGVYDQGCA